MSTDGDRPDPSQPTPSPDWSGAPTAGQTGRLTYPGDPQHVARPAPVAGWASTDGWPVAEQRELRDRGYLRALASLLLCGVVGGALLGVLHAWLWVTLSNPPDAKVYSDGIFLDEQALGGQAVITLWYFVLAVGLGLVAGLVIGWFGRRVGWPTVLAVVLMSAAAALVSRWLGVDVLGPDPRAEAAHAKVGDLVQVGVQVSTWVAYLGWALGGLVGAIASIAGWSIRRPPDVPA